MEQRDGRKQNYESGKSEASILFIYLSSPCMAWKVYVLSSSVLSWVFRLTIND